MDPVELYRRTSDEWLARVRAVKPDAWDAPSPCTDWNARDVVNHIVGEELWLPPLMDGATVAEVGDRYDGDLLGDDPVVKAEQAAADAVAGVPQPVAEKRIVHLSFGDFPASEYTCQLAADHLIHAWDLAAAVGGDRRLDPELVSAIAEWFGPVEGAYRGAGAIADRPEVGDQDPQTQLLAAFGRNPNWSANS